MIFRELFHQGERGLKYFLKIKNYRTTGPPLAEGKVNLSMTTYHDDDDDYDDDDDDEKGR